jgi:hypothetical protein
MVDPGELKVAAEFSILVGVRYRGPRFCERVAGWDRW